MLSITILIAGKGRWCGAKLQARREGTIVVTLAMGRCLKDHRFLFHAAACRGSSTERQLLPSLTRLVLLFFHQALGSFRHLMLFRFSDFACCFCLGVLTADPFGLVLFCFGGHLRLPRIVLCHFLFLLDPGSVSFLFRFFLRLILCANAFVVRLCCVEGRELLCELFSFRCELGSVAMRVALARGLPLLHLCTSHQSLFQSVEISHKTHKHTNKYQLG